AEARLDPLRCMSAARVGSFHRPKAGSAGESIYRIFIKSRHYRREMMPAGASYLRDPITVTRQEKIENYCAQAARYSQLAAWEGRSSVRDGLLDLARQCDAMADALVAAAPRQG